MQQHSQFFHLLNDRSDGLVVRASALRGRGHGFDPQQRQTKVFKKTGSNCFLPALRIIGTALRLTSQCQDNGLIKCWLKKGPGNMNL